MQNLSLQVGEIHYIAVNKANGTDACCRKIKSCRRAKPARADADLKDAARKIAFLKLCNSGQICININQVAVAEEVADAFLSELKYAFEKQIGTNPLQNEEYPHMISTAAYEKCRSEAAKYTDRIVFGGHGDPVSRRFEPTILFPVSIDEGIVQHEHFSPLLPIIPFPDPEIDRVMNTIADREHPLALYLFRRISRGQNMFCLHSNMAVGVSTKSASSLW